MKTRGEGTILQICKDCEGICVWIWRTSSVVLVGEEMAEDLSNLWGKFSLSEEECRGAKVQEKVVEGGAVKGKNCLVGKMIVNRLLGKNTTRAMLTCGWQPTGSFLSMNWGTIYSLWTLEMNGISRESWKGDHGCWRAIFLQ